MNETAYYRAAKKIAKRMHCINGCCNYLSYNESNLFTQYFKPTEQEILKYRHSCIFWMSEIGKTWEENNELRILALLFMDEFVKTDKP